MINFVICLVRVGKREDGKFQYRHQALQINKQFTKMQQFPTSANHQTYQYPVSRFTSNEPLKSGCILLPTIKDQQVYLSVVSTFLAMTQEAGVPSPLIQEVSSALLRGRGLQSDFLLKKNNDHQLEHRGRRERYNGMVRGSTTKEMKKLLEILEKEMFNARQKQKQYRCLQKYRKEKEEQIAPTPNSKISSKKERFKNIVRNNYHKKPLQSSNFYEFSVEQILKNSFKSQNECYKTINNFIYLKTLYGHASEQDIESYSQIYNAIYDRSQNLIITGGQEGLIKVWHRQTGTLIKSLKGHTEFLNKIDTSKCNKYLLSCGGDGIRFFDLKQLKPLGGWKTNPVDQITSFLDEDGQNIFMFSQNSNLYLLTEKDMLVSSHRRLTLEDFTIFSYEDVNKDASALVITLSPEKTHLIIGLETGQFLLVLFENLIEKVRFNQKGQKFNLPVVEIKKAHYNQIIEIKWGKNSNMWSTGSKDGRCCLWELKGERSELLTTLAVNKGQRGRKKRSFSCTYICWNCTYSHFAAGFQENIEEQDNTQRGQGQVLVYSLKDKIVTCQLSRDISLPVGGIKAMDSHPYYPNILLICQAQGHIILFDLFLGCIVNVFQQRGYHILHPQFCLIPSQCRFAQNGLSFMVASQYGSVSLYGYDSKIFYALCPSQQFLQTDFAQFKIEQNSMKATPMTIQFHDDINNYPTDSILTIKGQPYHNIIKVNCQSFLFSLNQKLTQRQHIPEIEVNSEFLRKVQHSMKEGAYLDQSYYKTYEQIQNSKQIILFHERERQYAKVNSLTTSKIQRLRSQNMPPPIQEQRNYHNNDNDQQQHVRPRKIRRKTQRQRINYADDFSIHDSQEEDYNLNEELPQQLEQEEESFSGREEEQPRLRRRQRQRRILRQTRQHNNVRYNQQDYHEDREERVTRKRTYNQYYREDHEEQGSQSFPKKKIKLHHQQNEESSEPKRYTRLRKQAASEQNLQQANDCYRCQIVKATQCCDKCEFTQRYCYQCSLMRGKKIKEKYKCLFCLFLNNEAPQQSQIDCLNEQCYRITQKSKQTYVPQLQDQVRFFFQGYEQFLVQNVSRLNNKIVKDNPEFRILPHTQNLQLLNVPLCKVKTIQYYFPVRSDLSNSLKRNPGKSQPNPILMLIGLEISQLEQQKQQQIIEIEQEFQPQQSKPKSIFWVYYIPGFDFLLPEQIYSQIMQKEIISKMQINQLIEIKDEQMQIVEIGAYEDRYPESIWKMIKIRKTEGKRLRGNTKQIEKRINIWKISPQIQINTHITPIEQKHVDRLTNQIQKWINEDSPYCIFIDYVDFDIYSSYREHIPLGICLQTILQRLCNNYYNSYESMKADFFMIYGNSLIFNGPNHTVTNSAEELYNHLSLIIITDQPIPQPVVQSKKLQQQTSNSKKEKQKRKRDHEYQEYFEPFFVDQTRRKTRKDDIKPKRRRESSDYSQLDHSQDQNIKISTRGGRNKNYVEEEPKRITRSRTKH